MNAIAPQLLYSMQHTVATRSLQTLLAQAHSALLSAWHAPEPLVAGEHHKVSTRLTLVLDPMLIPHNDKEDIQGKLDAFCVALQHNKIQFVVGYDPRSLQTRIIENAKPAHTILIQLFTTKSGHCARGMPSF